MKIFTIVKEQSVCIVERFGKYHKTLSPGLHFIVPIMDTISYKMSLKEETITVENQQAITKDNVSVLIGGTLFIRIDDPYKASYNVERPLEAVKLLALTVLRSEIGKMKLDKLFQERQELNKAVNAAVNKAASVWGIKCMRYEILQIDPPNEIKMSMQQEAEAERLKRRDVVISEGKQQAEINVSEGLKLSSIKRAEGEADSLKLVSQSESDALQRIGQALENSYLKNYERTLRTSNLIVAPEANKNQEGKSGGQDLITVAAMLMLNGTNAGRAITSELQNGVTQIESASRYKHAYQSHSLPANSQASVVDYPGLIEKMKFYEDPILYSSDDELIRKGQYSNNASTLNHDSSQSVNLSSEGNHRDKPIKLRH